MKDGRFTMMRISITGNLPFKEEYTLYKYLDYVCSQYLEVQLNIQSDNPDTIVAMNYAFSRGFRYQLFSKYELYRMLKVTDLIVLINQRDNLIPKSKLLELNKKFNRKVLQQTTATLESDQNMYYQSLVKGIDSLNKYHHPRKVYSNSEFHKMLSERRKSSNKIKGDES